MNRKFTLLGTSVFAAMMVMACTPKKEVPKADATASSAGAAATTAPAEPTLNLKIGSDLSYAPFESKDPSGKAVGFDIDIADAMCAEMKAKCEYINQDFDGIIAGLNAKKYDVIASSLTVTDERKQSVLFTDRVWGAPNRFIAKTGSTLQNTPDGLKGKTIAVQTGTIQETYAKKYYPDSKIKSYKTIELAYSDMTNNRVDTVFGDGVVVLEFLKTPAGKGYAQLGADIPDAADTAILGQGTAFAVRKEDTALAEKLNKALATIRSNGTYKTIADKYFTFDIYGK